MSLGFTCTAEEILDVQQFRHDFLFGLVLGTSVKDQDFVSAWSRWTEPTATLPCPKTQSQAVELMRAALWGNMPDSTLQQHLLMQLDRLSTQIGVRFEVKRIASLPTDSSTGDYDEIRPRLPWVGTNSLSGAVRIELHSPVISVSRVRAVTPDGQVAWSTSGSKIQISNRRNGVIHVTADTSTAMAIPAPSTTIVKGASNLFSSALRFNMLDTVPDYWAVDYLTGPVEDGRVGHLPVSIKFQVWCQAARFVLGLNSTVTTKGVSNQSRSVDGVSNSITLTNTAMYDVNSALELILEKYGENLNPKMLMRRMKGVRSAPL